MTLKQLREDERIYEIERVYDEDFKYEVTYEDGYLLDGCYGIGHYSTVKEIEYDLKYCLEKIDLS